ncbi:hypothetical protein DL96DRAFT_1713636 [Flagelloscypha sp. PMI_526]|nr:hypothetical protein DL96DRAFT_1713636 [Flagelloscypha sp. PMI_526]
MGIRNLTLRQTKPCVLKPALPPETWELIAAFLSQRDIETAAFLHPTLAFIVESVRYKEVTIQIASRENHATEASFADQALQLFSISTHVHKLKVKFWAPSNSKEQLFDQVRGWLVPQFSSQRNKSWIKQDTLRGFDNITQLHLLTGLDISRSSFSLEIDRHPVTSFLWVALGTRLTSLRLDVTGRFNRMCQMLPPEGLFKGEPLPVLETMELRCSILDMPDEASVRGDRVSGQEVLRFIASLYIHSKTLKKLTLADWCIESENLPIVLPALPDGDEDHTKPGTSIMPSLRTLFLVCFSKNSTDGSYVSSFLTQHQATLSHLRLTFSIPTEATEREFAQILFTPALTSSLSKLDLEIICRLPQTFSALIAKPPYLSQPPSLLIQHKLTYLALCMTYEEPNWPSAISCLGDAVPLLEELHMGPSHLRISKSTLNTLATRLPRLWSLNLTISGTENDNGVEMTCLSFVDSIRRDPDFLDVLQRWKLTSFMLHSEQMGEKLTVWLGTSLIKFFPLANGLENGLRGG